jgi:hypothetical protein
MRFFSRLNLTQLAIKLKCTTAIIATLTDVVARVNPVGCAAAASLLAATTAS